MTPAEAKLQGMLKAAGLIKKASYRPGEVQRILGISERTFHYLISRYEPGENGQPKNPNSLDSYKMGHHRVWYHELVSFIDRNQTYERNNTDDRQLGLF
ncbi:MAG: DNA-binding protein [Desulfuromonas sp.]|nr:MAG: DNA-binding protein [Desulfuromonas sp.]